MSNRAKLFIPAAFFVTMLGLLLYGLGRDPNQVPSALVNRPLPEFNEPDLFDPARTISSTQLSGAVIDNTVWAETFEPLLAQIQ